MIVQMTVYGANKNVMDAWIVDNVKMKENLVKRGLFYEFKANKIVNKTTNLLNVISTKNLRFLY